MQLQGIQFPYAVRDQGASVELLKYGRENLEHWIAENQLHGDRQWGIISQAKSKEENLFLSLAFRRVLKTKYKLQNGRLEKTQEETTEPELGEFHFRNDGLLELYSCSAKHRNLLLHSVVETLGKEAVRPLVLSKEAMLKLMQEAAEVGSVSFTGLGNPFFSDATITGTDPMNSKTYKEFLASGYLKSFRAKYHLETPVGNDSEGAAGILMATVQSNCKLRFYGGQNVQVQSDIEDFATKVAKLAEIEAEAE